MSNIVTGGLNVYGYDIGVLMLDSKFPRIVGDVGNAKTWKYPVLFRKVNGKTPDKVVLKLTMDDIKPFIDAAKELQKQGVKAITTSCGFLALFQRELAQILDVPIFTSALIMLPMISRMIGNKKVLVLTANSDTLTKRHIESVCGSIDGIPMKVVGTQHKPNFTHFTVQNWDSVDIDLCRQEIIDTIDEELKKDSDYGAILFECTNMPPHSDAVRQKFGLPVFDFISLMNFVHYSVFGE